MEPNAALGILAEMNELEDDMHAVEALEAELRSVDSELRLLDSDTHSPRIEAECDEEVPLSDERACSQQFLTAAPHNHTVPCGVAADINNAGPPTLPEMNDGEVSDLHDLPPLPEGPNIEAALPPRVVSTQVQLYICLLTLVHARTSICKW
jgi:hypothetical protein